ncbi:MAG: NAD(P)-dependent oxidoreductase [Desulfobacteraceae bacterium]|nr:MAG: NAD(P)-dependent oxidoreductase [Desulfobacteraceae bacterium]
MEIGFIGLGNMGSGIAANLLKAGHRLAVYDLRFEAAGPLLNAGASWSDTPKALAAESEIVFTSLPGPPEVEAAAIGRGGLIEGIRAGGVFIDLSTNSPTLVRRLYQIFEEKGAHMMDAPVSGGVEGAKTGRLAVMAGGDEAVFERCRPVLNAIGDRVTYTGEIGSGSICKLMHNCILYGMQALFAECFTLGVKAGAEPEALWKAISGGAVGRSVYLTHILPETYFRGRFDPPNFALKLAYKDVGLAMSLAREFEVPMAFGNLTLQELMAAMNRGWGEKDSRSAMLLQEERAGGVQVRIPDAK